MHDSLLNNVAMICLCIMYCHCACTDADQYAQIIVLCGNRIPVIQCTKIKLRLQKATVMYTQQSHMTYNIIIHHSRQ